jgi:membrane associated rhomboid family serine protease
MKSVPQQMCLASQPGAFVSFVSFVSLCPCVLCAAYRVRRFAHSPELRSCRHSCGCRENHFETAVSAGARVVLRANAVTLIVVLAVVLYVAHRATTAEERQRVAQTIVAAAREARTAAARGDSAGPFREALRARTPRVAVTPALVGVNALVFLFMLVGAGSLSDPDTLVRWGGNFGPLTANGEWWRLVATTFVHSGMLSLLVNIVGVFQLGLILERIVGPVAFAVTYVSAAVCAGIASLWLHPIAVNAGAAAAVCGIYGLLVAASVWSIRHRSAVTMPRQVLKRAAPAALLFVLYNFATAGAERALLLIGLLAGIVCGGVLMKNIGQRKPPLALAAAPSFAICLVAVVCAAPLRGMIDARPDIERLVALEERTASTYHAEVERFKDGRITADKLAVVIDRTIAPEVLSARARFTTLKNMPREQQALVTAASEYLRLREESWNLRAEALHKSNISILRKADRTERAALDAFQQIRPPEAR